MAHALTLVRLDVRDLALVGANGQILFSAGGSAAAMAPVIAVVAPSAIAVDPP